MGPFLFKKEIPANPITLVNLKFLNFYYLLRQEQFYFFVWLEMFINLYNPK